MAEISEKLYKKYAKITKVLVEICDVAKGIDSELNTQDYLTNFDLLLQALMFYQLKSNGKVCPKEQSFIGTLTESADLLEVVKGNLSQEEAEQTKDINWSNLFNDKIVVEIIGIKVRDIAKEYAKKLVAHVALAECLDGKSYFTKLNDETVDLLYYFAKLENGADEEEVEQGILGYVTFVANNYVEVMGNMEEFFADKKIKKELLVSLRKDYKKSKRSKRLDFLDKHIKSIKERLSNLVKRDKE